MFPGKANLSPRNLDRRVTGGGRGGIVRADAGADCVVNRGVCAGVCARLGLSEGIGDVCIYVCIYMHTRR